MELGLERIELCRPVMAPLRARKLMLAGEAGLAFLAIRLMHEPGTRPDIGRVTRARRG